MAILANSTVSGGWFGVFSRSPALAAVTVAAAAAALGLVWLLYLAIRCGRCGRPPYVFRPSVTGFLERVSRCPRCGFDFEPPLSVIERADRTDRRRGG